MNHVEAAQILARDDKANKRMNRVEQDLLEAIKGLAGHRRLSNGERAKLLHAYFAEFYRMTMTHIKAAEALARDDKAGGRMDRVERDLLEAIKRLVGGDDLRLSNGERAELLHAYFAEFYRGES